MALAPSDSLAPSDALAPEGDAAPPPPPPETGFPTTGLLDDFNRANTGPPPSANWTTALGITGSNPGLRVVSNRLQSNTSSFGKGFWNPTVFGADQEIYVTMAQKSAGASTFNLYFRLHDIGSGTTDGYVVQNANGTGQLYKYTNGALSSIGASWSWPINNGDSFGVQAIGDQIGIWRKPAGGEWALVTTRTDATYEVAGNIGVGIDPTDQALDDFSGGTVVPASIPDTEVFLSSITSGERFAPLVPRAGLTPGPGVQPYSGGASWAEIFFLTSILSSEAWGGPVGGFDFAGTLGSIESGEDWFSPAAQPPRVGLYPGAGLHPARSGVSWVNYSLPAEGISSAEEWGNLQGVSVLAAKVLVYVVFASALRQRLEMSSS